MFLGPLEQFKPWDTKGISGVHNFLKKLWRHVHDEFNKISVTSGTADNKSLKSIHKTIKKVEDDIERYSFNTVVSTFMICLNELIEHSCNDRKIISDFLILLSPYAPHISEEIWSKIGNNESITSAPFPVFESKYLIETEISYPVSFNGKMRFKLELPAGISKDEIQSIVMDHDKTKQYIGDQKLQRIIIVPNKIINIVF